MLNHSAGTMVDDLFEVTPIDEAELDLVTGASTPAISIGLFIAYSIAETVAAVTKAVNNIEKRQLEAM